MNFVDESRVEVELDGGIKVIVSDYADNPAGLMVDISEDEDAFAATINLEQLREMTNDDE